MVWRISAIDSSLWDGVYCFIGYFEEASHCLAMYQYFFLKLFQGFVSQFLERNQIEKFYEYIRRNFPTWIRALIRQRIIHSKNCGLTKNSSLNHWQDHYYLIIYVEYLIFFLIRIKFPFSSDFNPSCGIETLLFLYL